MKLQTGQLAPDFTAEDVLGHPVRLHDLAGKKVYLSFLRNTDCPLCSLHVVKLIKVADQLRQNGTEVIVFYESGKPVVLASDFLRNQALKEGKLTIVSDPERKVYELYGAEISPEKATLEALQAGGRMENLKEANALGFTGYGQEEGTHPDAIPADFLLDEGLVIRHAHYGTDSGDTLPLGRVESFARSGVAS